MRTLWLVPLSLALCGAVPPSASTYVFELNGQTVGAVSLRAKDGRYQYRSLQLFNKMDQPRARTRAQSFALDAGVPTGPALEGFSLWRGALPEHGCVEVVEELSGKKGPLCVEAREGSRIVGTVLGEPLAAEYGREGVLRALTVGPSRFTLTHDAPALESPDDLFADRVPILGAPAGELSWDPALSLGEVALEAWPDPRLGEALAAGLRGGDGDCLEHARRFVAAAHARGLAAAIVHGLWAPPAKGRALPHAWVRIATASGTLDLDPTVEGPVTSRDHLALAVVTTRAQAQAAGERWLAVFSGRYRVVRRSASSPGRGAPSP